MQKLRSELDHAKAQSGEGRHWKAERQELRDEVDDLQVQLRKAKAAPIPEAVPAALPAVGRLLARLHAGDAQDPSPLRAVQLHGDLHLGNLVQDSESARLFLLDLGLQRPGPAVRRWAVFHPTKTRGGKA